MYVESQVIKSEIAWEHTQTKFQPVDKIIKMRPAILLSVTYRFCLRETSYGRWGGGGGRDVGRWNIAQNFSSLLIIIRSWDNTHPIYTRDGWSVWTNLGKEKILRPIIRQCINTGKPTDRPSRRTICVIRLFRPPCLRSSSWRMIRLCV